VDDDRRIGRKPIIQFLSTIIGCTSWSAVRNQVKFNGLPMEHAPNGKPYVVPDDIKAWLRRKSEEAVVKAANAGQN